jgi:hypothetical protein
MKSSLHSSSLQLLKTELQASSFAYKIFKENKSHLPTTLKPLPNQNKDEMSLDNVQSFYIRKMSDFGFTGFNSTNFDLNFMSRSETSLFDKDSKNLATIKKFEDLQQLPKKMSSSHNRLSALTYRDLINSKSDLKNDIENIPSFNDKIKYLKEKEKSFDSSKKIYDINNSVIQKPKISQFSEVSSSAKFNSPTLNICKSLGTTSYSINLSLY